MEEALTLEQQKAMAMARARLRLQKAEQPEAKQERTMWQRTGDDIAGLVRGAGSIGATLLAPKDYLEDYLEKRATGKPTGVSRNEQRRKDMTSTLGLMGADTDSTAFGFFKGAGEMAGVAGMPFAKGGSYVPRVLKNTMSGGAVAGLINPEDAGVGAAVGGAVSAAGKPLSALYHSPIGAPVRGAANAAYHVVEPWLKGGMDRVKGRTLNELAGNRRGQVISELENARSIVPGSNPIAGEAATGAGSTTFAAGQEILKGRSSSAEYLAREIAQEKARRTALKIGGPSIGPDGDTFALQAAQQIREEAAKKNYGKAFAGLIKDDPVLADLMTRPSMQAAFGRAKELAKEKNQAFAFGETKAAQTIPGRIVGENGLPLSSSVIPAQTAQFPVSSLHKIKKALDDVIAMPERFVGIGESERAAAMATRKEFIDWLGKKSKAYDFARMEHARLSKPVNRMEIMGELESRLASSMGQAERPAMFARALDDAPKTIKSATGIPRSGDLSTYLGHADTIRTKNVMDDLIRHAEYKRQAAAGAKEASKILREEFKPKQPPGILERGVMIARAVLERVQGKASEEAMKQLSIDMLDPKKAAALMRLVPQNERFAFDAWARAANAARNPLIATTASE